ncbi:helix-turn-helix domain-containing protein [Eubacterium barkeri]|uniref:HTH cro/C1-type domain-containing protein n=1 Tax=Eubacterium barkeri TaxID=1528 RepID=A0A1H3DNB1_EUBBA|nr:helix-turn-helix transcriptional regulator [Eubacterium barkeri]SDX68002.1 hypothetical protein SAMN04488579_10576 [Eubacterium barkeri]
MSLFSERLTQYIESKHVKIAALSRFLDYDRSTLYRIMKGTRPPASLTQVQSICQFLQLNPAETTALIDAYYATLHGEVCYAQHQSILALMNSFNLSTTPLDCPWSPRVSMVTDHCKFTTLDTPTALTAAFFRVVSEAVQIEDGSLELITQPDCINLYSIIDQLDVHGELLMTHLLCLDNTNGDASSATYNIDCLKQSLALLSRHRGYRAFCYYDDVLAHFSPYSLYPCLVLSRQGAVLFDAQCTSGFFIQTQDALNQLRSYTQRLKGHCIPMYQQCYGIMEEMAVYSNILNEPCCVIEAIPCILPFVTEDILNRTICNALPQREALIQLFLDYTGRQRERVLKTKSLLTSFTPQGLDYFVETGRTPEIPDDFYHPLAPVDRLYLLKQVLLQIKTGRFRIMKMDQVHLHLNLVITTMAQHLLMTFHSNIPGDQSIVTAYLDEPHLVQAFASFWENLGDYQCLYDLPESVAMVEERIARLESNRL